MKQKILKAFLSILVLSMLVLVFPVSSRAASGPRCRTYVFTGWEAYLWSDGLYSTFVLVKCTR